MDRKKIVTIIVAFHFMKRRLKSEEEKECFFSVSRQLPSTQGLEKNECIIMVATESGFVIEKVETIIYCI